MKTFKNYRAAMKAADGLPVVKIGRYSDAVYIVGFDDLTDAGLTEVSVVTPSGVTTGHITLKHLDRLGNANHAQPHEKWLSNETAFGK